jgi:hypothetical protein
MRVTAPWLAESTCQRKHVTAPWLTDSTMVDPQHHQAQRWRSEQRYPWLPSRSMQPPQHSHNGSPWRSGCGCAAGASVRTKFPVRYMLFVCVRVYRCAPTRLGGSQAALLSRLGAHPMRLPRLHGAKLQAHGINLPRLCGSRVMAHGIHLARISAHRSPSTATRPELRDEARGRSTLP